MTGWWFQTCFIFHNIWDNPSHWQIFFKMVKTTNQMIKEVFWKILVRMPENQHKSWCMLIRWDHFFRLWGSSTTSSRFLGWNTELLEWTDWECCLEFWDPTWSAKNSPLDGSRGFPEWGTPSYHALIHRIFHEINKPSITWGIPIFGNIQWQPSVPKGRNPRLRLAGCSIPEATRAEQLWDLAVQVGVLI